MIKEDGEVLDKMRNILKTEPRYKSLLEHISSNAKDYPKQKISYDQVYCDVHEGYERFNWVGAMEDTGVYHPLLNCDGCGASKSIPYLNENNKFIRERTIRWRNADLADDEIAHRFNEGYEGYI